MRTPRSGWLLASVTALLVLTGSPAPARAEVLYAVNGAGPNPGADLLVLDPTTGAVTQTVGPIGFSVAGLTFDPQDGMLYATTGPRGPNADSLIRIDPATGSGTRVGSLGVGTGFGTLAALAFDATSGTLYGWSDLVTGSSLYRVDVNTGRALLVGPSGINVSGSGLAADTNGRLFLAGPDSDSLYTVDPRSGLPSVVAALSGAPSGGGFLRALAFDGSGTLFGIDFAGQPDGNAFLVIVDPRSGVITERGPTAPGVNAIAFGPGAVTAPVPEPSALVLGGISLLGVGPYVCRRRPWLGHREVGSGPFHAVRVNKGASTPQGLSPLAPV
jgi:hypothetical protein